MNITFYVIGWIAIAIGSLLALIGASSLGQHNAIQQAQGVLLIFSGVTTVLSGILYLGFGAALTFLERIANNTAAQNSQTPTAVNQKTALNTDNHVEDAPSYQGQHNGIHWWKYPQGGVVARFPDEDRNFPSFRDFDKAARSFASS